jgi:hypothetical protein
VRLRVPDPLARIVLAGATAGSYFPAPPAARFALE